MVLVLLSEFKILHKFFKHAIVTTDKLGAKRNVKTKMDFLKEAEACVDSYFDKERQESS